MTQHTPGPWSIYEGISSLYIEAPEADILQKGSGGARSYSKTVCSIHFRGDDQWANARLIAAAPETAAERDQLKSEVEKLSRTLENCRNAHIADMEVTELAERVVEAARWNLPLAKGYAAAHPVDSNATYVAELGDRLAAYDEATEESTP